MLPADNGAPKCVLCGVSVHRLLFRYMWLGLGWRGRPAGKGAPTTEFTFCGPCADRVLEALCPYVPVRSLPARPGAGK